jgi:hypothetical protein
MQVGKMELDILPRSPDPQHIANVFFDKVPLVPKMIRRQKLMSNLRLPASHPQFPVSLAGQAT